MARNNSVRDGTTRHYLEPGDPHSFDDRPVQERREDFGEMCPRCQGRGEWNLTVDAYGKGKHFVGSCGACWGYGYLRKGQTCAHQWDGKVTKEDAARSAHLLVGRCLRLWKCSKCGTTTVVDSSD